MPTTPPPDLPSMPNAPRELTDYLRRLRVWAYQELDKKIARDEATPHLLLASYDQKGVPAIFKLQVTQLGVASVVPVPLGEGKP